MVCAPMQRSGWWCVHPCRGLVGGVCSHAEVWVVVCVPMQRWWWCAHPCRGLGVVCVPMQRSSWGCMQSCRGLGGGGALEVQMFELFPLNFK